MEDSNFNPFVPVLDRCKCCLDDAQLRNLWDEYVCDGESEIYGEMISECFALPWQPCENFMEKICESCVNRLRDAYNFKKEVLATCQLLADHLSQVSVNEDIKQNDMITFIVKKEVDVEGEEEDSQMEKLELTEEEYGEVYRDEERSQDSQGFDSDPEMETLEDDYFQSQDEEEPDYLEIEYLEDENEGASSKMAMATSDNSEEPSTRKWPKRKKKHERSTTYRNYTPEDLEASLDAVRSNRLTRAEASAKYNVPVKTISAKLRAAMITGKPMTDATKTPESTEISQMKIRILPDERKIVRKSTTSLKLYENIQAILEYSNATPIKGHWGIGYGCCFCKHQFAKPGDLKEHTLENHDDKREYMKGIDAYSFTVKLDITNLTCYCGTRFDELRTFTEHLKDHDVEYHTDTMDQIVPFKFDTDKLKCASCDAEFNYFKLLYEHMNEHFRNFECEHCDRGFVNRNSLKMHKYRHIAEEFRCRHCFKVFSTRVRWRNHERVVHKLKSKAHKCGYCGERFSDSTAKNKHETLVHGAEAKVLKCNACEQIFMRQSALDYHINSYHLLMRAFKCEICDKEFVTKRDVEKHLVCHTETTDEESKQSNDKFKKFTSEIKTILTYTNATPYKSKTGHYYCAYCSTDGPVFASANSLRTHTRTQHAGDRLRMVDQIMRPHYLNEVLKLDIDNLICVVCCGSISSWNAMFEHLKVQHGVDLDEAYTRVIPYTLSDELKCALCLENFPSYHILDGHMNSHYNNYICGECGDTFLAETRLKKHVETHSNAKFPCKVCGKVFTLEKYRKKHMHYVHNREYRAKCVYCKKDFRGEYARHLHVLEKHEGKEQTFTCEICNKQFNWRPYLLKHMRLMHRKREKKHKCSFCDKEFNMRYELKNHEDWHKGHSNYVCKICSKKFTSKAYLQKHYTVHLGDADTLVVIEDSSQM